MVCVWVGKEYPESKENEVYWSGLHCQRMGLHPDSQVTLVAKISASCPPVPNMNMETQFGGNRKEWLYYFFCQAKWKHSGLVPQELCPSFSGIGRGLRGFLSSWRSCFFFFSFSLAKFQMPQLASDNSATRSCVPEVIIPWHSFWNIEWLQESVRGKVWQVQSIICSVSESN